MTDPIDTDIIQYDPQPQIDALRAEVDRLRTAILAIPRHALYQRHPRRCATCEDPDDWPCPTERAHRMLGDDAFEVTGG